MKTVSKTLAYSLFIIDILLVVLFLSTNSLQFNLDAEGNFTTAYQALKLAVAAVLFVVLSYFAKDNWLKASWAIIATGFFYIALDEWFQIHEWISFWTDIFLIEYFQRVPFSAWVLAFLPVIIAAGFFFYFLVKKLRETKTFSRQDLTLLGVAILLLLSVPLIEVLGTMGWDFASEGNKFWIALEEGAEMLSISTFACVAVSRLDSMWSNPPFLKAVNKKGRLLARLSTRRLI